MFIGDEVRLDVCFNAAQARMANLACGEMLRRASHDAYHDLGTGLARVGPLGAAPGISRLVAVRFSDPAIHEDFALWAMRWEAAWPGGALFPALDADIKLSPAGDDTTMLAISGAYRPPPGGLGAGLDRAILHQVAKPTIRAFTHHIGAAIAPRAASPEAGRTGMLPEPSSWPEPAASVNRILRASYRSASSSRTSGS